MDIEEDWMEETADEIARREDLINKLDVLLEKTQKMIIDENEKTTGEAAKGTCAAKGSIKHVRFKTIVITHTVSRIPQNLWYSYQEYVEMFQG